MTCFEYIVDRFKKEEGEAAWQEVLDGSRIIEEESVILEKWDITSNGMRLAAKNHGLRFSIKKESFILFSKTYFDYILNRFKREEGEVTWQGVLNGNRGIKVDMEKCHISVNSLRNSAKKQGFRFSMHHGAIIWKDCD